MYRGVSSVGPEYCPDCGHEIREGKHPTTVSPSPTSTRRIFGQCRFCGGAVADGPSRGGTDICPRCDIAALVVGPKQADMTPNDYRDLVAEVSMITALLPQGRVELLAHYQKRVGMAMNYRRRGLPIPASLPEPLLPSQIAAYEMGKPLHEVLLKPPPPKPEPPRKPLADDTRKRRE
jgi:hypothetical protein